MATLVPNAGLANITAALHAYTSRGRYMQWGVGSGQSATSTDLADKTGTTEARTAGTTSQQTTNTTNDTYRVTGTITAASSLAITEMAMFDEAGSGSPPSGGNMTFYGDFSAINLTSGDAVTFTAEIVMDQA